MCEFAAQEKWVFVVCRKYDSKTDLIKRLVQQNYVTILKILQNHTYPPQAHWSAFVSVSWLRMRSACMTKGVQWRDSHYCHGVTTVSSPCLLLSISRTYSPALVAGAGVSTEWSLVHAYTHAYHPSEPAARPSPFCLPHALQKSLCGCKWSISHQ